MIKQIERMSKNLKCEAVTATSKIEIDGYTATFGTITENESGDFWSIYYYRNGDEVIAVPDFYLYEDSSIHQGSRGNYYELTGETLEII